jgi:hypothetical protein
MFVPLLVAIVRALSSLQHGNFVIATCGTVPFRLRDHRLFRLPDLPPASRASGADIDGGWTNCSSGAEKKHLAESRDCSGRNCRFPNDEQWTKPTELESLYVAECAGINKVVIDRNRIILRTFGEAHPPSMRLGAEAAPSKKDARN